MRKPKFTKKIASCTQLLKKLPFWKNYWKPHKKTKKKGDGKFLPKITVRDLVNMLEPQLFNDDDTGTKIVMQEDVARSSIAKHKKEESRNMDSPQKLPTSITPSNIVEGD